LMAQLEPQRLGINGNHSTVSDTLLDAIFLEPSRHGFNCAFSPHYPRPDTHQHQIDLLTRWWGAMAMAWDAIVKWERSQGMRFDQVFHARADLHYVHPLPCVWYNTTATFYTSIGPPDAFWIMSRHVAERALQSVRLVSNCSSSEAAAEDRMSACCTRLRSWRVSWWVPCFWTRELWASDGLRLATLRVNAFTRTHAEAGGVVRLDQFPDHLPAGEPPVSPIERGSPHPMHCFHWLQ
jgi:hypothetical protein